MNDDTNQSAEQQLTEESLAKVTGGKMVPVWKSDGAEYRGGKWQGGTKAGARERREYAKGGKTRNGFSN
jgi:hypothetical protein